MYIVDAHHHIGEKGLKDTVFGWQEDIEDVIKTMDRFNIDATILQPLGGAHDPIKVHNEIYQYSQSYPGRIFGLVSMNPKVYGKKKTITEIERCVNDLGFVGIKFHTLAHGIDPTSEIGEYIFETANRLGVPIMVCTGPHGLPFTAPSMLIPRAKQFPDLKIIMAHMGGAYALVQPAIHVAELFDNIYFDTTLVMNIYLEKAVKAIGAERIMFGTEHSTNVPVGLAKIESLRTSKREKEKLLGKTAIKVFNLKMNK